jgi:hypothetical protein
MKLDIRYSQKHYYQEIVEVSKDRYEAALALFKQKYDEGEYQYYPSFDEYLEDLQYEFFEELGIEISGDGMNIVDSNSFEDLYYLILNGLEE